MDRVYQPFLSRPGLAGDEDGAVEGRHFVYLVEDVEDLGAFPDDTGEELGLVGGRLIRGDAVLRGLGDGGYDGGQQVLHAQQEATVLPIELIPLGSNEGHGYFCRSGGGKGEVHSFRCALGRCHPFFQ